MPCKRRRWGTRRSTRSPNARRMTSRGGCSRWSGRYHHVVFCLFLTLSTHFLCSWPGNWPGLSLTESVLTGYSNCSFKSFSLLRRLLRPHCSLIDVGISERLQSIGILRLADRVLSRPELQEIHFWRMGCFPQQNPGHPLML